MENCKLLLFDLDGTLLRSDKTISERTLRALHVCREKGILIGVSTSRSEQNVLSFTGKLQPDILITSGGALVKYKEKYIYKAMFTGEETKQMVSLARKTCGAGCEITIDTIDAHYWNYKTDPKNQDKSWGESIYTDFNGFEENSLKMCVEIFDEKQAEELKALLKDCDCIRFSDGYWYKFTKKTATKEKAITKICAECGIKPEEITAFGDDYADIGMLKLCGKGIAMGNAIDEVKEKADLVIGSNDEDGIAKYLERRNLDYYTIEDIYALPEGQRAELIDGELYMMAAPGRIHQELVHFFDWAIENYIREKNGDCEVYPAPFAVFLNADEETYVEPDISVICDKDKLTDKGCNGAPDWIIEIVSPGSRVMDYSKKLFKYNAAGVKEYWIADFLKNRVMVYNFEHGTLEEYTFSDKVKAGIYEDFEIDFSGINIE